MTRKLPIFYSALLLTGVSLLLRLVSTSFQVYISGRIGAAGVGLLQLVLSVGMLAMTAGMAGIRTSTMYLTAEELGRKKPANVSWVLSGCFIYSIVCSCTVAAALYFFAPQIAANWIGDSRTVGAIRTLAGFLPVSCLCGVMTGYFTAANRISTLAAVEVAEQLLSMTVTLLFLQFWAGTSPAKACHAVVLGSAISTCLTLSCLIILRMREKSHAGPRIPVRKRLLETAVPLALADDLKSGISTAENLMVPKRLSLYVGTLEPLAAFGMVCGMVFPVIMFPAAILFGLAELLIPELARCSAACSHVRIQYLVKRCLRVAMLYGLLFSGLIYLLSADLCMLLYGNEDASRYMKLYALLLPVLYCDAITDAMTKGLGQQKANVRYNIITSTMDIAFLYMLLPHFGMDGYYFSFTVTHLLNFGLSLRRLIKISHARIRLITPLLAGTATVLCTWAASHITLPTLRTAAYLALLSCSLFLLKIIDREDLAWLKGLIHKK